MLLHAANLSIERNHRPLAAPLTINLNAGEVLLLRGPNGSGKSTALRLLAGLLPANAVMRAPLSYLGHRNALHPQLTAQEQLTFWQRLNGQPHSSMPLEQLGLTAQASTSISRLSAGQQRRLALARLLAEQRPLWLLDEPAAGLDAPGTDIFLRLLAAHRAAGGAAVIAVHGEAAIPDATPHQLAPHAG